MLSQNSSKKLENKIALVTGAAEGIGQAISKLFLKAGATVILADVNEETGKKLEQELGEKSVFMKLDVSKEEDWKSISEKIKEKFGRLDVLINNAGIIGLGPKFGPQDPEHASIESWRLVHTINLDGTFLGCKYAIGLMKENGGSIVNMSSRSGIVGVPGAAAYASSKGAIRNHTKSVALYCAQQGYAIRCNSIHPASIMTNMWKGMLGTDPVVAKQKEADLSKDIPMGRFGTPDEVADGVLFLASDQSSYMTGSELNIDGGILAGTSTSPGEQK